jgi:hypothetical protein
MAAAVVPETLLVQDKQETVDAVVGEQLQYSQPLELEIPEGFHHQKDIMVELMVVVELVDLVFQMHQQAQEAADQIQFLL